jgi:hypothetical protein
MAQNSSLSTTFTLSSTDMTSDTLSFTVSETLALTGSGGIKRFNINSKYTGSAEQGAHPLQFQNEAIGTDSKKGVELYAGSGSANSQLPNGITGTNSHTPVYLYLKNVTGSGFSSSAAGSPTTASNVHVFTSGAGALGGGPSGSYDIAVLKQGNFMYMPINPNQSYYAYTPTGSLGIGTGLTGTIIEYAVFR